MLISKGRLELLEERSKTLTAAQEHIKFLSSEGEIMRKALEKIALLDRRLHDTPVSVAKRALQK